MKAVPSMPERFATSENTLIRQNADSPSSASPTKSQLLTELMRRPDFYDQVDTAWRLVMWLILVGNGVVVCGYEELAAQIGSNKSTVKKWADAMDSNGILERNPKKKQVELRLKGPYWDIAKASDALPAEAPVAQQPSPRMQSLAKIIDGAEELGGQVTMTLNGCNFSTR